MNEFIYNITTNLPDQIHDQWLSWLQTERIPAMVATGCFKRALILRLKNTEHSDGITYAVQFFAENEMMIESFLDNFSVEFEAASQAKWGNQTLSFSTVLEVVN